MFGGEGVVGYVAIGALVCIDPTPLLQLFEHHIEALLKVNRCEDQHLKQALIFWHVLKFRSSAQRYLP